MVRALLTCLRPNAQHPRCFPPGVLCFAHAVLGGPFGPPGGYAVSWLSCRSIGAQAIKTLGGICQIVGVLIVVRDLLAIHDYLGDLDRLAARVQARRASVEAAVRRLLPRRSQPASVGGASLTAGGETGSTGSARLGKAPGPFIQPPHQLLREQIAGQAEYLNRLRDWMVEELKLRDQVTDAESERARAELVAERGRV